MNKLSLTNFETILVYDCLQLTHDHIKTINKLEGGVVLDNKDLQKVSNIIRYLEENFSIIEDYKKALNE